MDITKHFSLWKILKFIGIAIFLMIFSGLYRGLSKFDSE